MGKQVKCRVVTAQYGQNLKGDVIEVDEREVARVSPINDRTGKPVYEALIPLDEERRAVEEAQKAVVEDPEAMTRKRAEVAWRELSKKSDDIMKERQAVAEMERSQKVMEQAGKSKAQAAK